MYEIAMLDMTLAFLKCWKAARIHIDNQVAQLNHTKHRFGRWRAEFEQSNRNLACWGFFVTDSIAMRFLPARTSSTYKVVVKKAPAAIAATKIARVACNY
jgi:hypothetical protein